MNNLPVNTKGSVRCERIPALVTMVLERGFLSRTRSGAALRTKRLGSPLDDFVNEMLPLLAMCCDESKKVFAPNFGAGQLL